MPRYIVHTKLSHSNRPSLVGTVLTKRIGLKKKLSQQTNLVQMRPIHFSALKPIKLSFWDTLSALASEKDQMGQFLFNHDSMSGSVQVDQFE